MYQTTRGSGTEVSKNERDEVDVDIDICFVFSTDKYLHHDTDNKMRGPRVHHLVRASAQTLLWEWSPNKSPSHKSWQGKENCKCQLTKTRDLNAKNASCATVQRTDVNRSKLIIRMLYVQSRSSPMGRMSCVMEGNGRFDVGEQTMAKRWVPMTAGNPVHGIAMSRDPGDGSYAGR